MSGREKIETYQYDRKGKYIAKYNSLAEVRSKYYPDIIGKYPIFARIKNYHILPDDTILLKDRTYRDYVVRLFHRIENPLIFKESDIRPVEVLNMDGDVIATFINPQAASILTGISDHNMWSFLNRNEGKNIPRNKLKISFRYGE